MKHWTKLWITWAVLAIGGFFVIEMPAVFNDETGDTLTEHIVEYVPYEPLVAVFGGLVLWLAVHFSYRYAQKRRARKESDEDLTDQ
jgi:hypothetical protein